jgi:mannose-1-phosphate guanylyltransferase
MILAAGFGTRLNPLSQLCAKPAMPIRGVPVIAHTLALLAKHDVSEVVINLHHLPDTIRDAVSRHLPDGLEVTYSYEPVVLGTGGAIRAVADFLRSSDPALILAGDMLVDLDLAAAVARHRERGDRCTLLLRAGDSRAPRFGTLGVDDEGCLCRIGERVDFGGETQAELFMGIRILSARCLTDWPAAESFEDLTDWLAPQVREGARDIRADPIPVQESLWEPVGTAEEYLAANLAPPDLSYRPEIPGDPQATLIGWDGENATGDKRVILGTGARIEAGATLERVVVWPHETVDADSQLRDGIYAGGRFVTGKQP